MADFILLETGDKILLETGDKLLNESSSGGGSTYTLSADAGSYTITGSDAALRYSRVFPVGAGSYTVTGSPATLTYTAGPVNYTLTANAGSYSLTGSAATLRYSGVHITSEDINTRMLQYLQTLYSTEVGDLTTLITRYIQTTGGDASKALKALYDLAQAG